MRSGHHVFRRSVWLGRTTSRGSGRSTGSGRRPCASGHRVQLAVCGQELQRDRRRTSRRTGRLPFSTARRLPASLLAFRSTIPVVIAKIEQKNPPFYITSIGTKYCDTAFHILGTIYRYCFDRPSAL